MKTITGIPKRRILNALFLSLSLKDLKGLGEEGARGFVADLPLGPTGIEKPTPRLRRLALQGACQSVDGILVLCSLA